ncbi:MAG: hypothetical protein ACTHOH_12915 [Lysobacteraceae bacterium]
MSSEPVFLPRSLRRIAGLVVFAGIVAACGKDPAPPAGAGAGDAAGAAAMVCPSSDPVAFVAAFAEDPALQRAFTAPTVEVASDTGTSTAARDQLAFPVMPDRAAQQREGLRQGGFERADDRITVALEAPAGGAQSRYVFRRDAACWVLGKIAGRVAIAPSTPAADPRAIVRAVMASRYGDRHDAERDCWPTTRQVNGVSTAYCLRPGTPSVVETGAGRQLLFLAGSVQDVDHSPRKYAYASTDPGLVGLFVVALRGGGWSLVAAADGEAIGTNGDCACITARLQRMGRDVHGWTMVDGTVVQGVENSAHVVFAPVGGKVVRVATVPDVVANAQDVHHDIAFDAADPAAERYPLIVTTRGGSGDGARSTIAFDPAGGRYPVPAAP